MRYVWDAAKDVLNQRKHGLSLADGISALEDKDCESWVDDRFNYEEQRIITLGRNEYAILLVVTIEQGPADEDDQETTRIISVRKATRNETDRYYFS